jgi:hypothetical protein
LDILANGQSVAVVGVGSALVNINTSHTIAGVTRVASAGEGTNIVGARCDRSTVVSIGLAFINISTSGAGALVPIVALARERSQIV